MRYFGAVLGALAIASACAVDPVIESEPAALSGPDGGGASAGDANPPDDAQDAGNQQPAPCRVVGIVTELDPQTENFLINGQDSGWDIVVTAEKGGKAKSWTHDLTNGAANATTFRSLTHTSAWLNQKFTASIQLVNVNGVLVEQWDLVSNTIMQVVKDLQNQNNPTKIDVCKKVFP